MTLPTTLQAPAIAVENTVRWSTPHPVPFRFTKGKRAPIYFVTTAPIEGERQVELETLIEHGRTAVVGRVWFKVGGQGFRAPGGIYRDVDAKGIGIGNLRWATNSKIEPRGGGETRGLLELEDARLEARNAHRFLKAGIRTALPIAIAELHEIVDEKGQRISIDEARARRMLARKTKRPAVLLRAFGTKFRVGDIDFMTEQEDARAIIDDAKAVLKKEQGRAMTDQEYITWFTQNLGQQVARMHNAGLTHGYLTTHNITLDGRIVDLDSVEKLEKAKLRKDCKTAMKTMGLFFKDCKGAGIKVDFEELGKLFERAYLETISRKNFKLLGGKETKLFWVLGDRETAERLLKRFS